MRRTLYQSPVIAILCLLSLAMVGWFDTVVARAADAPSLTISQLKITSSNGQFVLLYNTTDNTLDMAVYQLEYFNHYDVGKATSSRLVALSGTVPPHGYYLINDSTLRICQRMTLNSASLGFSSTAGMVQLRSLGQANPGGAVETSLQDYVGWSKTAAPGAQTLPSNTEALLMRKRGDQYTAALSQPGEGAWQAVRPDSTDPCAFVSISEPSTTIVPSPSQLLSADEPDATVLNTTNESSLVAVPAPNIGLKALSITEILPNPAGTGTDASDEYIEVHNSNTTAFDLSGYSLQIGLTTLRTYTFPAGTSVPPQTFRAFHSSEIKFSLSNSGAQVKLLDPSGAVVATAEPYPTAKDGQAWALAQGKWRWTLKPTPGQANVIQEPVSKKAASRSSTKKTTKGTSLAKNVPHKQGAALASGMADEPIISPVHIKTLALVGGLAILYGAYEYRQDMANRIHQLRRYISDRRGHRSKASRR